MKIRIMPKMSINLQRKVFEEWPEKHLIQNASKYTVLIIAKILKIKVQIIAFNLRKVEPFFLSKQFKDKENMSQLQIFRIPLQASIHNGPYVTRNAPQVLVSFQLNGRCTYIFLVMQNILMIRAQFKVSKKRVNNLFPHPEFHNKFYSNSCHCYFSGECNN